MELIVEKRSVTATAESDWKRKWAPAINSYAKTLKGKMYKQNEHMVEERGMCMNVNYRSSGNFACKIFCLLIFCVV